MMPAPTAGHQIAFLTNVQRILSEGQFTATYKYALLQALADIAVEIGDDSGGALVVPTALIAEKFVAYYWRHVTPYVPAAVAEAVTLKQNTMGQAAIVNAVSEVRRLHGDCLAALQRNDRAWRGLVRSVDTTIRTMPLWKLQRVGDEVLDFLYEQRGAGREVMLRSGVAFCLRKFHVLLTELVRAAWLQYIRKYNAQALGSTTDLTEFLFGCERSDVAGLRPVLMDLQKGSCFYCPKEVRVGTGHIDHFIPWARYPMDLGHNFVLAHDSCNGAKGMMLAAEEHLASWVERSVRHRDDLSNSCISVNIGADLNASVQIARWAYGQAFTARSLTWVRGKEYRALGPEWDHVFSIY
jgi:hypothetical protein